MSHQQGAGARFSALEKQGVFRMESHADWHGEDWGQYQDDIDALQYYGTLGLYDPTIPGEVGVYKKGGAGIGKAIGMTFARAVLPFTILGYFVDPADKREGGWAEYEWYQEWGPPSWSRPSEWIGIEWD